MLEIYSKTAILLGLASMVRWLLADPDNGMLATFHSL